jgi:phosphate transport system permease protein
MILLFADSLERVPLQYSLAATSLGSTKVQRLVHILLPQAGRGLVMGTVLAFGRAMGDTMIALMLAGNAVAMPGSLLDAARTLTSHIALVIAADVDSPEFRTLFVCGLILYVLTTTVVLFVRARLAPTGRMT